MSKYENWQVVEGFNNTYHISDNGRLLSLKNGIPRFLKGGSTKAGYVQFAFSINGECVRGYLHRLVAQYFVSGYFEAAVVNHKNGNKRNNHYSNLEWVTSRDNIKHAIGTGLMNSGGFKLSSDDSENIRRLFKEDVNTQKELSLMFDVNYSTINRIINNKYNKIRNAENLKERL